jgi:hypothetical protein
LKRQIFLSEFFLFLLLTDAIDPDVPNVLNFRHGRRRKLKRNCVVCKAGKRELFAKQRRRKPKRRGVPAKSKKSLSSATLQKINFFFPYTVMFGLFGAAGDAPTNPNVVILSIAPTARTRNVVFFFCKHSDRIFFLSPFLSHLHHHRRGSKVDFDQRWILINIHVLLIAILANQSRPTRNKTWRKGPISTRFPLQEKSTNTAEEKRVFFQKKNLNKQDLPLRHSNHTFRSCQAHNVMSRLGRPAT